MGNREIFERMASSYDTVERIDQTKMIAATIRNELKDTPKRSAMDYGCGTGLVGLELADIFENITFIDASSNMIGIVQNKIDESKIGNPTAVCADLCVESPDVGKFDVIMMSQVLLHIKDFLPLIKKLYTMLNDNGRLIIVDFNKNDKVISDMVHNGFDRTELADMLEKCGFTSIHSFTFYEGKNIFMGQDASLFLMNAMKSSAVPER